MGTVWHWEGGGLQPCMHAECRLPCVRMRAGQGVPTFAKALGASDLQVLDISSCRLVRGTRACTCMTCCSSAL